MTGEEAREAQRKRARKHYEKHRDALLEGQRQIRRDPVAGDEKRRRERERIANLSPEERERRAQLNRDWYRRNPRSSKKNTERHLQFRYGLTPAGWQEMFDAQGGCCYLCADPLPADKRQIHVDHDHVCCSSNRSCGTCIRGLACEGCNTGVGCFRDDPERMRRVADNLEAANRRL
jgi:hypothetical protein